MKLLTQVLHRPVITEKSAAQRERKNMYVFEVAMAANKHEIQRAVEKFFGVKVLNVRTMRMPAKPRRMGRYEGTLPAWKKAVVTLSQGEKIDIFDLV